MIRVDQGKSSLPTRNPALLSTEIMPPALGAGHMERILVVEDDRQVQKALKRLFETEGFHEQKINYFGKWLIGIENGLNAIPHVIYKAILFGALVYLVIKGIISLFQ